MEERSAGQDAINAGPLLLPHMLSFVDDLTWVTMIRTTCRSLNEGYDFDSILRRVLEAHGPRCVHHLPLHPPGAYRVDQIRRAALTDMRSSLRFLLRFSCREDIAQALSEAASAPLPFDLGGNENWDDENKSSWENEHSGLSLEALWIFKEFLPDFILHVPRCYWVNRRRAREDRRRLIEGLRRAREDRRRAEEDRRRAAEDRRRAKEDRRRAKEVRRRVADRLPFEAVSDDERYNIDL